MKNKCYGCEDRVVGCHSFCEEYKKFRKKLDDINKKRRQEQEADSMIWNYSNKRKRKR